MQFLFTCDAGGTGTALSHHAGRRQPAPETPSTPAPETPAVKTPKKGDKVSDDKKTGSYIITSSEKKEVAYKAPANKNAKTITIPATIKVKGVTYKVTKIRRLPKLR